MLVGPVTYFDVQEVMVEVMRVKARLMPGVFTFCTVVF